MKKISLIILAAIPFLVCAITQARPQDSRFVEASKELEWSGATPMDFLNLLKKYRHSVVVIDPGKTPPQGWIKQEHVAQLMQVIGSIEAAAPVILRTSPYMPPGESTVGNEAMFLIEGFRKKSYPPLEASVYYFKPNQAEYRRWWIDMALQAEVNAPIGIGSAVVYENRPTRQEVTADSKSARLSAVDELWLQYDVIKMGAATTKVLVNRLTGTVEYVWSNGHQLYVKPQFIMPKAQELYDRRRG